MSSPAFSASMKTALKAPRTAASGCSRGSSVGWTRTETPVLPVSVRACFRACFRVCFRAFGGQLLRDGEQLDDEAGVLCGGDVVRGDRGDALARDVFEPEPGVEGQRG